MNFQKIKNKISHFWLFIVIGKFFNKLVIPGFDGISLSYVSSFFFRGLLQGSLTQRAAALSFTFFLALFPAIIFFFTLIPFIPIHGLQDTLLGLMKDILPKAAYSMSIDTLEDIIKRQHGQLLSFGFIATVYFSTSGISGIMDAFNNSIHVKETRSFVKQKLIAILLVIIFSVLTILAISLVAAGSVFLNLLQNEGFVHHHVIFYILNVCKWIITIMLYFFNVSFLYYIAPAHHQRFRFISAGSTFATVLFILTTLGFNYYISNFSNYNKLYGSIGVLIIILTWIYINAIVLLTGFELNASIMNAQKNKKKKYLKLNVPNVESL